MGWQTLSLPIMPETFNGLANSDLPKRSETFNGLANSDLPIMPETFEKKSGAVSQLQFTFPRGV